MTETTTKKDAALARVPARGGHVDAPGRPRDLEEARAEVVREEDLLRHAARAAAVRVGGAVVASNTTGPRGHADVAPTRTPES